MIELNLNPMKQVSLIHSASLISCYEGDELIGVCIVMISTYLSMIRMKRSFYIDIQ